MLCARCGKLNPSDLDTCKFCGARLCARRPERSQETAELQPFLGVEDYLLDKLSLVERQAHRSSEDLGLLVQAMDYLERNVMAGRAGVSVLAGMLRERGLLDAREFKRRWLEQARRGLVEINRKERFLESKAEILDAFKGRQRRRFEEALARAEDLFLGFQSDRAVEALHGARALDPANAPLNALLGQFLVAVGEPVQARACLGRALAAAQVPRGARLAMAVLHLRARKPAEAGKLLEKAVQADPADAEALTLRAFAHGARGRWAACLADAERALASQDGAAPRYLRAQALLRLGRTAEGETALEALLAEDPDCEPALRQRAHLLLARGWAKRAGETLARLRALDPEARRGDPGALFRRAGKARRAKMRLLGLELPQLLEMMNPEADEARLYLREVEGEL